MLTSWRRNYEPTIKSKQFKFEEERLDNLANVHNTSEFWNTCCECICCMTYHMYDELSYLWKEIHWLCMSINVILTKTDSLIQWLFNCIDGNNSCDSSRCFWLECCSVIKTQNWMDFEHLRLHTYLPTYLSTYLFITHALTT